MSKEEQLKLECGVLMEESKSVRDDILFHMGASRQVINLTITATGILIAGTPFIVESRLMTLFLIIPLIFYALAWAQIRYLFVARALNNYLNNVLAPRLRQALVKVSPNDEKDFESILSLDTFMRDFDRRSSPALFLLAAGNYGITLLVVVLSIMAYFIFAYQWNVSTTIADVVLIVLNVVLFSYTAFIGIWARFDFAKKKSKSG